MVDGVPVGCCVNRPPFEMEHHPGPRSRRLGWLLAQILIYLLAPNCDLSRRQPNLKDKK